MKRTSITLIVLCCIMLSACGDRSTVGIIGGSDGPTSIITSQEPKGANKRPVRMIKVDGKLYYDSGRVSEVKGRCGTLDGELKCAGKIYEIPQNDNECNFEGAEGYQNTTSITKEVPIDNKWVIFKLFDDPEMDMSDFKYCFYLRGRLPNAKKDSELVALTEDKNYDFEDYENMFLSMLSSRHNAVETNAKRAAFRLYGDTDKWGISLTAKDITSKGLTLVIEQFGGKPTGELQTGEAFSLEAVNDKGDWSPVATNPLIDYAWDSIAYGIRNNDITELKTEWKWLYGELPDGYYRLKKEITDFRDAGDFDKEVYELYFTIE